MGRFVSGGGAVPRKQSIRLLASNPSIAIPSWARVAYITGCGGGGGGGTAPANGSAAASAIRCPINLLPGDTTMGVVIGAAGAANANGGATDISVNGVNRLRLGGGTTLGNTTNGGGRPAYWNGSGWVNVPPQSGSSPDQATVSFVLVPGASGIGGNDGHPSLFGGGGGPTAPATGYGAGGGTNQPGSPGFLLIEFEETL